MSTENENENENENDGEAGAGGAEDVATLLAQPNEVLLHVMAQLSMAERAALAGVNRRFAALFNDRLAWRHRLAGRFTLSPGERRLVEATAARLVAAGDTRPPAAWRTEKRVYELLARNEAAALRFPAGYDHMELITGRFEAAVTRAGLVALRDRQEYDADRRGLLSLELDVAPDADAHGAAVPPDWRRLPTRTLVDDRVHFGGAAPDGAAVLLADSDTFVMRGGAVGQLALELVDTREAVRAASCVSTRRAVVTLQPSALAVAHFHALVATQPPVKCQAACLGVAWAEAWVAVVYRMTFFVGKREYDGPDNGYVTDVHVLARDGAADGGGIFEVGADEVGWHVLSGDGAGTCLDAAPRYNLSWDNEERVSSVLGALDEARLLLRRGAKAYQLVDIDVAARRVAPRFEHVAHGRSTEARQTIVAPGTVAAIEDTGYADAAASTRLQFFTVDDAAGASSAAGGSTSLGRWLLGDPLDAPGPMPVFKMHTAVGQRLWVQGNELCGIYQRRPSADKWRRSEEAGALVYDQQSGRAVAQRDKRATRTLDGLSGFTSDLGYAWTFDHKYGAALWRVAATRTLVSAEFAGVGS